MGSRYPVTTLPALNLTTRTICDEAKDKKGNDGVELLNTIETADEHNSPVASSNTKGSGSGSYPRMTRKAK